MSSCIFQYISALKLGPMEFLATENLLTSLQILSHVTVMILVPVGQWVGGCLAFSPMEGQTKLPYSC